jgi:ABC-type sugar transport system ATPase subunit/ribose/xylose/arabinose/galactoside ABC-type transport system permease subunit
MAAASVQLLHVSKSFPGVRALDDVSLSLRAGSIHALLGENGAGKSTLINILGGVLKADAGEIRVDGTPVVFADARAARRQGLAVVHQEVDLFPELSVAENIGLEQGLPCNCLGLVDWSRLGRHARHALQMVHETLAPADRAGTLSPAQRQMVLIAAAVSEEARVLVLDEPTSSLSAAEVEVLFHHLRRFRARGAAILYVSHRLEEIFRLADEATVLRDGRFVWSGPLSATSRAELIERMVGRTQGARRASEGSSLAATPGSLAFACRDLSAADGSCTGISLEVRAGEVVGLYGLIGAGRSEWAQTIFGLRQRAGGEIRLDGQFLAASGPGTMVRAGLAYVPEDRLRQGLCRGLSVTANTMLATLRRLARGPFVPAGVEARRTQDVVTRLGVRLHSLDQAAGTLSGGNQQKIVLGRWLGCEPRVLILDEPTRGVDVGAKEEIHALIRGLAREGRAVILISSDLPEVLSQSDRVGVFRAGKLVGFFDPRTADAAEVAEAALPEGDAARTVPAVHAGHGVRSTQYSVLSTGERQQPAERRRSSFSQSSATLRELALVVVLLALGVFLHVWTGRLTGAVLQNLASVAALLAFPALGTAVVILAGGIDISIGALMALSAGVAAVLWQAGWPVPVACAAAVAIGGLGGLVNASLALAGRVHPIVITLGTMSLYRGLAHRVIGGIIQVPGRERGWLLTTVAGVPLLACLGLALALVVWLFLTRTVTGRELYAVGGNPMAARRVGIHPARAWLVAFTLQGFLVGAAGFLALTRNGNVQGTDFDEYTLAAIAAAVVGGVAILGGRGSAGGVVLGALFLAALEPACILLHVAPTWQRTLAGAVLVVAVTLDALWRRRGR